MPPRAAAESTTLLIIQRTKTHHIVPDGIRTETNVESLVLSGELDGRTLHTAESGDYYISETAPDAYTPIDGVPETFVTISSADGPVVIGQLFAIADASHP